MQKHFFLGRAIALVTCTTFLVVFPHTSYSQANPKSLNNSQVQSLKAVGISIAVPSYIPNGFEVSKVDTEPCAPNATRNSQGICNSRSSYKILYRNSGSTCFSVYGQYTRGIGGGAGEFSFPVVTELFGKTWIGFGKLSEGYADKTPSSQQLRSPQQNISSFPVYQPGTPIIYGVRTVENQDGCTVNQTLTPLEIEKVLQSLRWLS